MVLHNKIYPEKKQLSNESHEQGIYFYSLTQTPKIKIKPKWFCFWKEIPKKNCDVSAFPL